MVCVSVRVCVRERERACGRAFVRVCICVCLSSNIFFSVFSEILGHSKGERCQDYYTTIIVCKIVKLPFNANEVQMCRSERKVM